LFLNQRAVRQRIYQRQNYFLKLGLPLNVDLYDPQLKQLSNDYTR